jgi:transglutaminase-like putative cysteine protease
MKWPWQLQGSSACPLTLRPHLFVASIMLLSMLPILVFSSSAASTLCVFLAILATIIRIIQKTKPRRLYIYFLLLLPLIAFTVLLMTHISSRRDLMATQMLFASFAVIGIMQTTRGARAVLCMACLNGVFAFGLWQAQSWGIAGAVSMLISLAAFQGVEEFASRAPPRPWSERFQELRRLLLLSLSPFTVLVLSLPYLHIHLFNRHQTTGVSDVMHLSDLAVYSDPAPVLRVHYAGPAPSADESYFRAHTLWSFDGTDWTGANIDMHLSSLRPPSSTPIWVYSMEPLEEGMDAAALDWPTPFPDRSKPLTVSWSGDGNITWLPSKIHWLGAGSTPKDNEAGLDPGVRVLATSLPQRLAPRSRSMAKHWLKLEPHARVLTILNWMQSRRLVYTLAPPSSWGSDATDFFLFQGRSGYCQSFSSAFVVLARSAGVPARIVTGYHGGTYNEFGNYWLIRHSNAHAWAEVWLSDTGWTRIDPTSTATLKAIDKGWWNGLWEKSWWKRLQALVWAIRDKLDWDSWSLSLQAFVLLFFGILGSVIIVLVRFLNRRKKLISPTDRAWKSLLFRLHRIGIDRQRAEDPLTFALRAMPLLDAASFSRLLLAAKLLTSLRYGAHGVPAAKVFLAIKKVRPRKALKNPL